MACAGQGRRSQPLTDTRGLFFRFGKRSEISLGRFEVHVFSDIARFVSLPHAEHSYAATVMPWVKEHGLAIGQRRLGLDRFGGGCDQRESRCPVLATEFIAALSKGDAPAGRTPRRYPSRTQPAPSAPAKRPRMPITGNVHSSSRPRCHTLRNSYSDKPRS